MQHLNQLERSDSLFGCRQFPTWYLSSQAVIRDFDNISKTRPLMRFVPNPFPLYDWIMGFYERWSNRRLLSEAPFGAVNNVLELGTGTGFLLGEIIRRTSAQQQITAIDLSEQMLRATRRYLTPNAPVPDRVTLERADCLQLPYKSQSFDMCISSYLLDLLSENEIPQALAEMERVLTPGGHALLLTMTTEFQDCSKARELMGRMSNEVYCAGYRQGRWNRIWQMLFAGYAPHCRPIALGRYINALPTLTVRCTRITHVSFLPARIYHLEKSGA